MDQTCPRTGLETRCPVFGVYASCPKLFLGRLVGPYAYVYGSCPCRQNQRQMCVTVSHSSRRANAQSNVITFSTHSNVSNMINRAVLPHTHDRKS
ncbi:hypothetical protein DPX16_8827 [Anabarilius grahami]|uniref:Uncharacterized protein n=1 Tax=Anabarilius grahami TaxID=495550 RepID=A0A3N0YDV7_ANAGA|nr:hypothetical protein DPX16_8827 [Anabarilius grahami]